MARITTRALNRATLARQGLLEPFHGIGSDAAVSRLTSLQAQHPEWPPVALAARSADHATADLPSALERRTVVRSSLMRITIHVVTADDLWPMFTVCQPQRLNQWRLVTKADPHESDLGRRMTAAHAMAVDALRQSPRSSLELDRLMAAAVGPQATAITRPGWRAPNSQVVVRAAWRHFAAHVPLVHVPHSGEGYGRSRYALAETWLGTRAEPTIEEARRHVARRYLEAFGPASIDDLVAFVGRGPGGAGVWRRAVEALGDQLVTLTDESGATVYDLEAAPRPDEDIPAPPRLLARWDSLLLSHHPKRRGRVLDDGNRAAVFSRNADVLPTFLVDGRVAGTWGLDRDEKVVTITLRPLTRLDAGTCRALLDEAAGVATRLDPAAEPRVSIAT
ncbi:MAG: winged helix DNA-binding domain-containing protein [Chloroflexi bacterium]|nr:winged helix DNA-binding domain-containing protein [Chloroflexota bacterium]